MQKMPRKETEKTDVTRGVNRLAMVPQFFRGRGPPGSQRDLSEKAPWLSEAWLAQRPLCPSALTLSPTRIHHVVSSALQPLT
ncbi:unnamed protein product [Boreogadus saida]